MPVENRRGLLQEQKGTLDKATSPGHTLTGHHQCETSPPQCLGTPPPAPGVPPSLGLHSLCLLCLLPHCLPYFLVPLHLGRARQHFKQLWPTYFMIQINGSVKSSFKCEKKKWITCWNHDLYYTALNMLLKPYQSSQVLTLDGIYCEAPQTHMKPLDARKRTKTEKLLYRVRRAKALCVPLYIKIT